MRKDDWGGLIDPFDLGRPCWGLGAVQGIIEDEGDNLLKC